MAKVISARLGSESIGDLIKGIQKYQNSLSNKCRLFVSRLSELGIQTARAEATGEYGGYIAFTKRLNPEATGYNAIIYARSTAQVKKGHYEYTAYARHNGYAYSKITKTEYEVDPLLMSEFGSGWRAIEPEIPELSGIAGQGTFPDQKHAFNPSGWYFINRDGNLEWSMGETPTRPMHKAMIKMKSDIERVAREVFN